MFATAGSAESARVAVDDISRSDRFNRKTRLIGMDCRTGVYGDLGWNPAHAL